MQAARRVRRATRGKRTGAIRTPRPLADPTTTDYANGGATTEANLGPTRRRHNLIKLDGGWRLAQPEPGRFVWTTPAGLRYAVEPEPVSDPTPDPVVLVDDPPPF